MDARQESLHGEGLITDAKMTDTSVGLMSSSLPATSIAFSKMSRKTVYSPPQKMVPKPGLCSSNPRGVTHASICNKEEENTWEFRRVSFAQ